MKNVILFTFIILNFLSASAQTSKIDSLENLILRHTKKDTSRVNLLNNFVEAALETDQKKSIKYADEAFEIASTLNYGKGKAESLYGLGLYYYSTFKYEKSLAYFQKSMDIYIILVNENRTAECLKYIGIIYERQGKYLLSLESYKKALETNKKIGNKKEVAVCLKYIGITNEYLGNYSLSIDFYQKAIIINEEIGNKQGKANCLHNIGIIYHIQGNYPLALEYYQKSLNINEEIGSKQQIANTLNNIGVIYFDQANYNEAFPYYEKSYEICKEISYKQGEARGSNNIGELYRLQNNFSLAIPYYQKSLKIKEEIGDKNGIARTMNNIGSIYLDQEKYSNAFNFFEKALKISKENNYKVLILDSYANIGSYYLANFNFKKALDYTQKSFVIAKELENLSQLKRIYLQTSEIYTATKNYKKALENYVLYNELNDSIFNEKNIKEITRLEYQYEFEKEKQSIELEQQKKDAIMAERTKQQHILNWVLLFVFVLMTCLLLMILRSFFQKRKANNILKQQKRHIEEVNHALILGKKEIQNFAFELEKANKTKDKFFSIIAHDLKNPFHTLLGFSDLLLKNDTTEEERITYVRIINESTSKTYKFLENLLTWAQSQTGKLKFTPEIINASTLISETISLLEESAHNKEIKLVLNGEKDLSLRADKNMIDTVIRNLVSNAIKFTHNGGSILVSSKLITDKNNQKFAEISVSDNGVGISREIQSKLFKITEKVSTKGTEEEIGTGLGLLLCKEFIDAHSGKIWVESETGKGSKFIFSIPISN
jgi:signal transduction histidine kinase